MIFKNKKNCEDWYIWLTNLQKTCLSTYIFAFGKFNFHPVNVGGIQSSLRKQFQALKLRKEILNGANIYQLGIKLTKCKYIEKSFEITQDYYKFKLNKP